MPLLSLTRAMPLKTRHKDRRKGLLGEKDFDIPAIDWKFWKKGAAALTLAIGFLVASAARDIAFRKTRLFNIKENSR